MSRKWNSYTFDGNVNWYSHYGEQPWRFFKKLKLELSYDPAIMLLGIYSEKNMVGKNTCTLVFLGIWFRIAKTQEQCKCPLADKWIKKIYIYTMEYYSAIKRNEIMSFVVKWMDMKIVIPSEVSQIEDDIYYMKLIICTI